MLGGSHSQGLQKAVSITVDCKHQQSAPEGHSFPCNTSASARVQDKPQKHLLQWGLVWFCSRRGFICQQLSEPAPVILQPSPSLACSQRGTRDRQQEGMWGLHHWLPALGVGQNNVELHPLVTKSQFQKCPNDQGAKVPLVFSLKGKYSKTFKIYGLTQRNLGCSVLWDWGSEEQRTLSRWGRRAHDCTGAPALPLATLQPGAAERTQPQKHTCYVYCMQKNDPT